MTATDAKTSAARLRSGTRISVGIRHLAAAALLYSVMGLLVKLAGERLPSSQLVLVRAVVCLTLSWAWLRRAGIAPWGVNPRALVLRGMLGTAGLVCSYYALVRLPLADAAVISNTSPVLTAVLAALVLGERASRRLIVAIACGIAGVVAMLRPAALFGGAAAALDPLGTLFAFGGALASASVAVLIRSIRERENALVVVFYFPLVTLPVILPFAIGEWMWPRPLEWLMLLGIGLSTQLAQVQMTRGLVLVPAGHAAAVGTIQVVLATLWGAIFFAEVPDLLTLVGALLVVVPTCALAMARSEKRARNEEGIVGG